MKKNKGFIIVILTLATCVFLTTVVQALEESIYKNQGKIMQIDIKHKKMIVNEKTFLWNSNSGFYDDKENPITVDKFKIKSIVYIVGEKSERDYLLKKIYLLPSYVGNKEENLYPFMQ